MHACMCAYMRAVNAPLGYFFLPVVSEIIELSGNILAETFSWDIDATAYYACHILDLPLQHVLACNMIVPGHVQSERCNFLCIMGVE